MTQRPIRQTTDQPVSCLPAVSNDLPMFLTAEEASRFLGGMHPRTLTRWAREEYIPAYPIGEGKRRLWRFRRCDLEQWMLGRRSGPAPLASDLR